MRTSVLAAVTVACSALASSAHAADAKVAVLPARGTGLAADAGAILEVLISAEPGMTTVERTKLKALLGEQATRLRGLADERAAARTGRLLQADYMIALSGAGTSVSYRIVQVSSAKVVAERRDAPAGDAHLAARAAFEALVAGMRGAKKYASRLTVGIGGFFNESGTSRSDALAGRMEDAIRKHLRRESWAIVLERQYPSALLAELGLARSGLAEKKTMQVERADIVVAGGFREQTREFARGLAYPVSFTVRLASGRRGRKTHTLTVRGQSTGLDAMARQVVSQLRSRRLTLSRAASAMSGRDEVERLMHLARMLAPRIGNTAPLREGGKVAQVSATNDRDRADLRGAIRALENVLLIEGSHTDARVLLGCCLVVLHERTRNFHRKGSAEYERARAEIVRGGDLVYAAVQRRISQRNAAHVFWVVGTLVTHKVRPQADRLLDLALAKTDAFAAWQIKGVRMYDARLRAGERDGRVADGHEDAPEGRGDDLQRLVAGFDPKKASDFWFQLQEIKGGHRDNPKKLIASARARAGAGNPYVEFCIQRLLGQLLRAQKDPEAVDHYLVALSLRGAAIAVQTNSNRETCNHLDLAYVEAYETCLEFDKRTEARFVLEQAVSGSKRSTRARECGAVLAALYDEEGRHDDAVTLCEEILSTTRPTEQLRKRAAYLDLRERGRLRRSGRQATDLATVARICQGRCVNSEIVRAGGLIWAILKNRNGNGTTHPIDPTTGRRASLRQYPGAGTSIAGVGGRTFIATSGRGLYVLDAGRSKPRVLLKKSGELPSDYIDLLVSTGDGPRDVVYAAFCENYQRGASAYGVARIDPRSLRVTVITSPSRSASAKSEPVRFVRGLTWDPADRTLRAYSYNGQWFYYQSFAYGDEFAYRGGEWTPGRRRHWPEWRVAQGRETLRASRGGDTVVIDIGKTRRAFYSNDPVMLTAADAAWDARRVWLATATGVHEVDRKKRSMRCILRKDDTAVTSVLKDGEWLYIGAADGVYRIRIP